MKKTKKTKSGSRYYDGSFVGLKSFKDMLKFVKKDKKRFFIAIAFAFSNALFYVFGSFLTGYIFQEFFTKILNNKGETQFDITSFSLFLFLMGSSFLLYGLSRYFESYFFVRVSFTATAKMRKEAMDKLMKMPISYHDRQKSGDLISTLINDINNVSNTLFNWLNNFFSIVFNILLSIIAMSLVSSLLTIISIIMALTLFLLPLLIIKKSQRYFVSVQNAFGSLNAYVEEMITNIKVTNSFDQKKNVFNGYEKIVKDIRNLSFKGDMFIRSFEPWFVVASNLIILTLTGIATFLFINNVSVWGVKGFGVDVNGLATPGLIVTFIALNWNFIGPFSILLEISSGLQIGLASSSRIFKLLDLDTSKAYEENIFLDHVKGEVEFKNVMFRYSKNSKKYQLYNATFSIKPGQTVAIVGPTGAGKTTIINLLCKFYDYESGSIKIDGEELRNINSASIRNFMSVVLQNTFLFNDTFESNFRIGKPNATEEEIIQAAKLSDAYHFINLLPEGFKTKIRNSGQSLSQGQRQLVSITRAILANKSILVLDEATSNVDSSTEEIIQSSLLTLMKNRTSFVIAHRLSTIKNADLILVVNEGKIIETGTHNQLLEEKGFYWKMYKAQHK